MKNKKILALIFVLLFSLVFAISSLADDALVLYNSKFGDISFYPGSIYSSTDLFDNLKGVMPGDKLTQELSFCIMIHNKLNGGRNEKIRRC